MKAIGVGTYSDGMEEFSIPSPPYYTPIPDLYICVTNHHHYRQCSFFWPFSRVCGSRVIIVSSWRQVVTCANRSNITGHSLGHKGKAHKNSIKYM